MRFWRGQRKPLQWCTSAYEFEAKIIKLEKSIGDELRIYRLIITSSLSFVEALYINEPNKNVNKGNGRQSYIVTRIRNKSNP